MVELAPCANNSNSLMGVLCHQPHHRAELSLSLPNLYKTTDTSLYIQQHNEAHTSMSDMLQLKADETGPDLLRATECSSVRANSSQNVNVQQCDKIQCNGEVNSADSMADQLDVEVNGANDIDVTVTVSPDNNRLSTVLENMSLVYLPRTKQLVSNDSGKTEALDSNCGAQFFVESSTEPADLSECTNNATHSPTSSTEFNVNMNSDLNDDTVIEDDEITAEGSTSGSGSSDVVAPSGRRTMLRSISQGSTIANSTDFPGDDTITNDTVSISSISSISTNTELSASFTDLSAAGSEMFTEVSLHSRNTYERTLEKNEIVCDNDSPTITVTPTAEAVHKKRGIIALFSRGIFNSKKPKDLVESDEATSSEPGWKLFGRVPPKDHHDRVPPKDHHDRKNSLANSVDVVSTCESIGESIDSCDSPTLNRRQIEQRLARKKDVEVSSTTGLILEQRPLGLPDKDPEEAQRHQSEYNAMIAAARKKEIRETKIKKKQMAKQLKHENMMAEALKMWTTEVLTNWDQMHTSKRTRECWWKGIPPSVRGRVWKLAIGNDLNITPELYEICLSRAKERLKLTKGPTLTETVSTSKEGSVELIKLDTSRTFPQLCIFQKGGPYHELLQGLLGSYVCYRPDVGYVQGMSFIAAVLLLNMEVSDAFICFANLLNRPCQLAFFRLDEDLMKCYFSTYADLFTENLPKLFDYFNKQNLTPDLYLIDWIFTLYSKSLPLDIASRVWDMFCRDGEEFLFRTALGILKLFEDNMLDLDFIHLAQFLTKLPEHFSSEKLFNSIELIDMTVNSRTYQQVLMSYKDKLHNTENS